MRVSAEPSELKRANDPTTLELLIAPACLGLLSLVNSTLLDCPAREENCATGLISRQTILTHPALLD